jgi:hypothetical protein
MRRIAERSGVSQPTIRKGLHGGEIMPAKSLAILEAVRELVAMLTRLADRDDRIDVIRAGKYRYRGWPPNSVRSGVVAAAVERGYLNRPSSLPLFAHPSAGAITAFGLGVVSIYRNLGET